MRTVVRSAAFVCTLASLAYAAPPVATKGPGGIWLGTLDAGAAKLRLAFHVTMDDKGALTTTMDSLDQGAKGLPVAKTTYTTSTLRFELPNLGVTFEGRLEGDTLKGTFTQGKAMPLTLTRVDRIEGPKRPQTPKRPFPYREEEVSITVSEWPRRPTRGSVGVKLAGTLTLPPGKGPFPAMLLVTGSGPQDRDETIFDHKPFLVLADALTRAGIATLRFDDRGAGKSEGSLKDLTTLDFVEDALEELRWLASRPEIDKRALGIIGHSEGALIAPILATRDNAVRLVVMLAGTGETGDKILVDQAELINRANGAPAARLAQDRKDFTAFYAAAKAARSDAELEAAFTALLASDPSEKDARQRLGKLLHDPWLRAFLTLDPAPYLQQVRVPILAIGGEKDLQVPPSNLPVIEAALRRAKNPDPTVKVLPGLNHLFQHARNGSPSEYSANEETFALEALKLVTDWVVERAARARR